MKRWAADMKRSDTSLWPWERNWEGVEWKDRCIVLSPAIFGLILDAFFSAVYCWSSLCQSWSKTLAKSTMNINYGTALYLMACILCILCMYIMALNDFHIHICMFVIFMWYSKVSKKKCQNSIIYMVTSEHEKNAIKNIWLIKWSCHISH